MRRYALWAAFIGAWLACLVALAPMRWLGELGIWRAGGISAAGASGTLWDGKLLGLKAGPGDVGDVAARLSLPALLGGTVAIAIEARDGRGELRLGRERGLREASGRWPLALQTPQGPLQLTLALDAVSAAFRGGRCFEAAGRIDAVLDAPAGSGQGPRLELSGRPTCRGGVVEARLLPEAGSPAVELLVQAKSDGHYRLTWTARAPDPALGLALALSGFVATPEGMGRVDEGQWGGAGYVEP